ncbi:MAG: hypothetical protein FD150_929 [Rhodobacteraceae bacterium]|nr:MAG: hypothetical protein FD150_929 [Paracoccaceae bacterium]
MKVTREPIIANETKSVCRLTARRVFPDGTETGNSTSSGFLWRHGGSVYVVTNWHCLSGLHAETLRPLGSFCQNRVLVEGKFEKADSGDPQRGFLIEFKFEVTIEDAEGQRLWIEHPNGNQVDIATFRLPIAEDGGYKFCCINEISYETRWRPEVGSDAFIVGFPEGVSSAHGTPIWKRASIASEPDLQYNGTPVILVDTIGNQGLSGSPVGAVGSGLFAPNSHAKLDTLIGSWKTLLGIYAGRLGDKGVHSQLGRVWRVDVVHELFQNLALN